MPTTQIEIPTAHGAATTDILTPDGEGPWPAVVLCFDAGGRRPAMTEIGERIAKMGYLVAIPDFYHRLGSPFDLLPPDVPAEKRTLFGIIGDPALYAQWRERFYGPTVDYEHLGEDGEAVLAALEKRDDVKGRIGTTGYCMGGNISLRLATLFGERIAATATFHGGGLATDMTDSPHLRAEAIKSRVYVAGAIEDGSFTDEAKQKLDDALTAAHVAHTIETYPAKHGFCVRDNPTFDAAAAERHFTALEELYAATLRA